jgi:hypothetical protein
VNSLLLRPADSLKPRRSFATRPGTSPMLQFQPHPLRPLELGVNSSGEPSVRRAIPRCRRFRDPPHPLYTSTGLARTPSTDQQARGTPATTRPRAPHQLLPPAFTSDASARRLRPISAPSFFCFSCHAPWTIPRLGRRSPASRAVRTRRRPWSGHTEPQRALL